MIWPKHLSDLDPTKARIQPNMMIALNPKSNLRKMIDDIDDTIIPKMIKEKVPFTPDLILGRAAKIKVFHQESNGSVYANIKSIMEVEKPDEDDAPPY